MALVSHDRRASRAPGLPYTMPLPDGRTVAVAVPARWVHHDRSGEVCFTPDGMRFLDKVQSLFMPLDQTPTPGFIRTLRGALELTQAELGEKVSVDKLTVSRWERGELKPSRKSIAAIRNLRNKALRRGVALSG